MPIQAKHKLAEIYCDTARFIEKLLWFPDAHDRGVDTAQYAVNPVEPDNPGLVLLTPGDLRSERRRAFMHQPLHVFMQPGALQRYAYLVPHPVECFQLMVREQVFFRSPSDS